MKTPKNFSSFDPRICAICVICGLLFPLVCQAQEGISKSLRANWQATKKQLMEVAEAMPEDKYAFKATPEQRSFGEQLQHLAEANANLMSRLAGTKPPETPKASGKTGIMKVLSDSYDYGDGVLAKLTDSLALEPMKAGAGETTRLRLATQAMTNGWNHYGQLVVYLRLNGIVPPASRPKK